MDKCFFTFKFNNLGRGRLQLYTGESIVDSIEARTGSISGKSRLLNAIYPGVWSIRDEPVETQEKAMVWYKIGWKARLYTPVGERSSYLIHPDGGEKLGNGTDGCIGLQGNGQSIRNSIRNIIRNIEQPEIEVHISKEAEDDKIMEDFAGI